MTVNFEQILNGKYIYKKAGQAYCEENFWLEKQNSARGDYLFRAEVLSRSHNGEFLKIQVKYLASSDFSPKRVEINRFMGGRESSETFEFNGADKEMDYFFYDGNDRQRFSKKVSSIVQVATPAFSSSLLITQKKRLDSLQRSQYSVLSTDNIWSYESEISEKEMYLELVELNPIDVKVGERTLKATHCAISPKVAQISEAGTSKKKEDMYLSKHYSIPYKGSFADGVVIEIAALNIV